MEVFQELLFTVGISLMVSFLIVKLYSMASPCHSTGDNSASLSVTGAIKESVFGDEKKSVVREAKSERWDCFVDEAVEFYELGGEGSSAETIGSPLARGDDGIVRSVEVCEEVGGLGFEKKILEEIDLIEAAKRRVLNEKRVITGGVEFEDHLVDESSNWYKFPGFGVESDDLVGISSERAKFWEIEIQSIKNEVSVQKIEEVRVLESEANKGNDGEEKGFFDDWEGIERTELEKRFGAALAFVGSKSNVERISSLDNDTKIQLYGLNKVAIEGPCRVPSPMALKVSARAKWTAWQQLGDMSREVAMEQYVSLLSRSIPGWLGDEKKDCKQVFSAAGLSSILPSNLQKERATVNESIWEELKHCDEERGMIGSVQTP
ncbi:hypothetical protein U1Q18_011937 [Sarracenia purpurea var. burkii]